ncbi:MAG: hypothetical protein RML56_09725 [Burkholderiales bacterium]|nr:hypothetical protein [Burkholderiales bacterium]
MVAPPPFLYDRLPGQTRTAGQTGTETGETIAQGGFQSDARAGEPPAPPRQSEFVATEQRGAAGQPAVVPTQPTLPPLLGVVGALWLDPYGPGDGGGFASFERVTLSGSGSAAKLLNFHLLPEELAEPPVTFSVAGAAADASAVINETTSNSIGAIWRRWVNGTYTESNGSSFSVPITPNNQFHYLGGPPTPPEVIAAKTGTFSMTDIGGTTPTNNLGQTGLFLISGAQVNFTPNSFRRHTCSLRFPRKPGRSAVAFRVQLNSLLERVRSSTHPQAGPVRAAARAVRCWA